MKHFFLILLVLCSFNSVAQMLEMRFDGTITNIDAAKKEAGVNVSLVQGGSTIINTTTASNGKYTLKGQVDYTKPFEIIFNKTGFVAKKVNFNLAGLNPEDTPAGDFRPVQALDMEIFGDRPNVDFSFLNSQPVADFYWDKSVFTVNFDKSKAAQMRTKIDKLLADAENKAAENEAKYNAAIAAADKAYNAKEYEAALAKYEEALGYKPKEKYPSDRIVELDAIIQKLKEEKLADQQQNAEYYNLIQAADNFRNAKEYDKAKAKYNEALAKKDEQYPKDEIKKIDAILKEKENQAAYDQAIELGDMMLKQKSYKAARDKYTEASKLKPSEQYPKTKLAEIDAKLKEQEDLDNKKKLYEAAVAEGDRLFTEENWEASKAKYQEAIKYESAATYPAGRIKMIDDKLAELKAQQEKEAQIAKLLQEGTTAMTAKKYEEALEKYKAVIALDAENATAKQKIPEIEQLIANAAKEAEKEAQFKQFVDKGDAAVTAKKLEDAVTNYESALQIKQDAAVQAKLTDVKKQLDDQKNAAELQAKYDQLMSEGKTLFDAKDYENALTKYQAAKGVKPAETAPQLKIDEIQAILEKQNAERLKNEELAALLQQGEALFASEKWDDAKSKFVDVLAIDGTNATAKQRIKDIDAKLLELANQAQTEAKFKEWVAKGDQEVAAQKWETAITNYKEALKLKQDPAVQQKLDAAQQQLNALTEAKENDQKYQAAITAADKQFSEKKYELAKTGYESALAIKPSEVYPAQKITEINKLMADMTSAAEKEAQIKQLLSEGQTLITAKDYQPAKLKYEQVLALDPSNTTAPAKLAEINTAMAAMQDQQVKDQQFEALKQEGYALAANQQWNPAKEKLNEALQIKQDAEVKAKIAEIDATLAAQKDKEARIQKLLTEGDKLMAESKLPTAKTKFEEVLTLDSENATAKQKIRDIETELAKQMGQQQQEAEFKRLKDQGYAEAVAKDWSRAKATLNQALAIRDDAEVKAKIAEIDAAIAAQKDKEARIQQLLSEGDQLITESKWPTAKTKFEEVLTLDSENAKAKQKIRDIETELAKQMGQQQQEAEFKRLKDQGYSEAAAQDWSRAKATLNQALAIRDDAEVRKKITEIDAAMASQNEARQLDESYQAALGAAQQYEAKQSYELAIEEYREASAIKPAEQLPKTKIAELTKLMNQQSASSELDKKYQDLLDKGDQLVSAKEYVSAIAAYNEALALKPTEQLPVEKAKRAQELADAQGRADEDAQYEKILKTIESKITEEDYTKAREYIDRAMKLRPEDSRPKSLLEKIESIERQNAQFADLMKRAETEANGKNYEKAINLYEQAKSVKPANPEPQARIDALRQLLSNNNEVAEKEALFKQYYDAGVADQTAKKYEAALSNYNNALNVKPTDAATKAKIEEVQQILDRLANERNARQEKQQEFNALVKEADGLFDNKEYQTSVEKYRKAQTLDPSNRYVQQRINEAEKLMRDDAAQTVQREYQKILQAADNNFNTGNYQKASEYYKRALSLKPTDGYPKKKLAEIDAILNPVSEVGPMLEPLGEVYDNSIMDGSTALAQAQAERENLKTQRVKNKLNNITDAESEMTAEKTDQHRANSNEIYGIYRSVSMGDQERDLNRQAVVDALRESENELAVKGAADEAYEHASNIGSRSYIEGVQESSAIDYGERESVYQDNHEKVDAIRLEAQNVQSGKSTDFYAANIGTSQELDVITSEYSGDYIDNTNKRIEESRRIEDVRKDAQNVLSDKGAVTHQSALDSKEGINTVYKDVAEENSGKSTWAAANNEKVKTVSTDIAEKGREQGYSEQLHAQATDNQIRNVQIKVGEDATDRDLNRLETVEEMKENADRYAEEARNQAVKEGSKYLDNKSAIEGQKVVNSEVEARADLRKTENTTEVERMAKQAQLQASNQGYSDEQERLGMQQKMENSKTADAKRAAEEAEKNVQSGQKLDDVNRSMNVDRQSTETQKRQSIYATKEQMNKIEAKQPEKTIVKNNLGEEYPEGVSEEVFQRKDDNGILSAIITRRVVVQEGHGTVYVKTQTLNATTYTKNGNPITEYVWQKETQAAHLERHY